MGVCASRIDVAEETIKILVLGFSGSGKTFVVCSWLMGMKSVVDTQPTDAAMFNVERIKSPSLGRSLYMWDLSGSMIHRRRSYFLGTQGIVYVVDAQTKNMKDVLADLVSLLKERDLSGVPLLVLVNKVVDGETISAAELKPQLMKQIQLPSVCVVQDIHLYSEQDLSSSLIQLEMLLSQK